MPAAREPRPDAPGRITCPTEIHAVRIAVRLRDAALRPPRIWATHEGRSQIERCDVFRLIPNPARAEHEICLRPRLVCSRDAVRCRSRSLHEYRHTNDPIHEAWTSKRQRPCPRFVGLPAHADGIPSTQWWARFHARRATRIHAGMSRRSTPERASQVTVRIVVQVNQIGLEPIVRVEQPFTRCIDILPRVFHPFELVRISRTPGCHANRTSLLCSRDNGAPMVASDTRIPLAVNPRASSTA